ncbi:MAG: transposase [Phycisphaerae bacterium]|nr:transposase [Phycisphaerae bacterium]
MKDRHTISFRYNNFMHGKRFNIDEHARFLTFSCFKNRSFLSSQQAGVWFANSLMVARKKYGFDLWAYVLMPDHVHLLLLPRHGGDVPNILTLCKRSVTDVATSWLKKNNPVGLQKMLDVQPNGKKSFRFWQRGGGYDRNIFSAIEAHEKIQYIHANPVRAGLIDSPGKWKWSSFQAWETDIDDPISIDRDSLPLIEK